VAIAALLLFLIKYMPLNEIILNITKRLTNMIKLHYIFSLILFFSVFCHTIKATYVPTGKNKELDIMFNQVTDRLDTWLDTYSMKEIDRLIFSESSNRDKQIIEKRIEIFVQKPIQDKIIRLKKYTFTELEKVLKNNGITTFIIKQILHTTLLEALIYCKMQSLRKDHNQYFTNLLKTIEKYKHELRKPL
jgi:lipopolysaccharide export LptBFGC system permease protein LptF